jgi:hypothetical protein
MSLRTLLRYCGATVLATLIGSLAMHGQSAAEYGIMTSNSGAAATASAKSTFPKITLPGSPSSAAPSAPSSSASAPVVTPEAAAKTNRQFFQEHSGPNAAQVSLHSVPDHAQAWIDGKFVGPTPLDLKLAPGHHRTLVRAPNMQDSVREFDVTAKQTQAMDFPLKPGYQSQVTIQWPSQKN